MKLLIKQFSPATSPPVGPNNKIVYDDPVLQLFCDAYPGSDK
jgi:hypothetical protein